MPPLTCAVIAAGSQGRVHARGYLAAPEAELVAVADPDTAAARELTMRDLARAAGVQFTVNLQRRFEPVHRFAREQLAAGAIGQVVSLEGSRSRRRVPLPLHPHDNALLSGLSQGFWQPAGEQRSTH